jgi:hypothetical protein
VYDIYILVMKKGQPGDVFTSPSGTQSELTGARANGATEKYIPMVVTDSYYRSQRNGSGEYYEAGNRNRPQIGDLGIGKNSGTVFKQFADETHMMMNPPIIGTFAGGNVNSGSDSGVEPILWVPPPDPMVRPSTDTTPSPLVYVFQKKVAF